MRIQLSISRNLMLLSLLGALCGCAASNAAVKSDTGATQTAARVIRDIRVAGEGDNAQVIISADQPLAYTFYTVANPPKGVIDLAQVEPGSFVAPMEINSGNIKRIVATPVGEGETAMTRVEVYLNRDVEMTAATDTSDKGTMRLSFVPPPAPVPAAVVAEPMAPQPVQPVQEASPQKPAEAAPTPAEQKPASAITAITPRKGFLEIQTTGDVADFKTFRLAKPDRLVLDIFGVKAAMAQKIVPVNSMGIGTVRVGAYPDKVRLVLDAAGGSLPALTVERTAAGLAVVPSSAPVAAVRPASAAVPARPVDAEPVPPALVTGAAPKMEAKPLAPTGVAEIESIDFKVVDGISRIAIATNGPCDVEKPAKSADGLTLNLKNCILPRKWQRFLDTSAFASVVERITPYQVKTKGRNDVKVQVKLRSQTTYELRRDGGIVYLDLKNPADIDAPRVAHELVQPGESDRTAPVAARSQAAPAAVTPVVDGKKVYTGRRVTLEFSDADVRKIFQLIAEVSNLNFIVGDDVTGTISLKLVNVPWDQALDVILDNKGLGMQRDGNIVQIRPKGKIQTLADEEQNMKKAREKAMELKTEVFEVNYAAVNDVVTQFSAIKSERGMISQDTRTNRVIVKDIAPVLAEMKNLLRNLDTPEKQVLIEARIVEATSTFVRDIGVQWGIHYRDGSAGILGINGLDTGFGGIVTPPPLVGFPSPSTSGGQVGISFGKLTSNLQVDLRLSAAATAGLVKIVSSPKVVTLNNKAAKISQGQSIPYQNTTSTEGAKTEFVEAALTLEVTPHITSDGSISMKIKATNNSAGTGNPPPINKKEATTELLVKNGETTVIGGIFVDSDTDESTGVPFLMDIPLLGWLFKSNTKNKTKTELLIFITPKIVS
ncbi:type IV pilus secretin PilQ [Geobacter sp.]|uniref:type IV pilus secretin PilQ n=1 Tax=Geobacter sp. TaxID=46610 RepID=UPI0027B9FC67|nr:type IV pilus secretin PilQ [Geobacter sp.]